MVEEILKEAKRQNIELRPQQLKELEACIIKNEHYINPKDLIPFWVGVEKGVMKLISWLDEYYV